ncbi:MAG: hypothetical protein ACQESR_22080 [Planctomycetota bacterium]
MRADEVRDLLRKQPFQPFRVRLSTGQGYEIRHPEFAALTRASLFVGAPTEKGRLPDRMIQCDLLHVTALEPLELSSSS